MVKLTVIVPVFNGEEYIIDTLSSIYYQTFKDWECLIIDDGSTDNTNSLVREYITKDKRFSLIKQTNKGAGAARNTGINLAKGELISFIDSDDVWYTDKLEKHVLHLDTNKEVGISCSGYYITDEDLNVIHEYKSPNRKISVQEMILNNLIGTGSNAVIRKEVFDAIGFNGENGVIYFREDLKRSQDYECWLRILSTTKWSLAFIPETLLFYRMNRTSLQSNVDKQYKAWNYCMQIVREYNPSLVRKYLNQARANQCIYLTTKALQANNAYKALGYLVRAFFSNPYSIVREKRLILRILKRMLG